MKLRSRTILALVLQLVIATVVISAFVTVYSLDNYSELEKRYTMQDLDQARYRVTEEAATLSALVSDWGPWDDTYRFAGGEAPNYIDSNLMPEEAVYPNLRLNLVALADIQGRILYGGVYDSRNRTLVPLPGAIARELTPGAPLANVTDPSGGMSGILLVEGRPMTVASRPIVRTDFSGEPRGVVLMGRYLDAATMVTPEAVSGHSLRLAQLTDASLDPPVLAALQAAGPGSPGTVVTLDDTTVAGYALLEDVHGEDALVLELTQDRGIFQQGVQTTTQVVLVLLGIWLAAGAFELFILDRLILSRVGSLRRQVRRAIDDEDHSRRIELGGDDELSGLADDINRTLETVYTTQARLVASEGRFRGIADLLPQVIFELDTDGRLTYMNRMGLEVFGLEVEDLDRHLPAERFIAPAEHERMYRAMDLVLAGEVSKGGIYTMVRRNGTRLRAFVNSAPILENGIAIGIRGSIFDLSERLTLEEALIESQEYLRSLLTSAPIGILVVDRETERVLDANPAALAMFGGEQEDVVGQAFAEVVRSAGLKKGTLSVQGQSALETEGVLITRSGEERSVLLTAAPVTLKGQSCTLLGFMDNSERHRVEEELRESTTLITGILQASPVGVFRLDSGGRFVFANDTCHRILGLPQEALYGRHWVDILAPHDREGALARTADAVRERGLVRGETRYVNPGGGVRWLHGQAVALVDRPEEETDWVGTITDVTEQKEIERALRESEEKYRALTENNPDVLFSARLDGVVTYVSPQVNRYGYLEADLVGVSIFSLVHPDERPRIAADHAQEIHANARFEAMFRVLDRWSNIYWVEAKSYLQLDSYGRPIGTFGVLRDISERKRGEEAIELANKKLNLMNNITRHDILNTITGLLGCVDMAEATTSVEERRALLQDIRNLTGQVQRQIAFTKEYQEVGVHLPRWQNVLAILGRVVIGFERAGPAIRIDLLNAEIYADPLVEKVFYNLVDNAIRYGGPVTTIRFYLLVADEGLTLVCEDDGIGIPEDQKQAIFERGVGRNTGMGLFLSREILGITGITIVENGPYGSGARFEIFTPRGTYRFTK